jgi:hypothetical protein
LHLFAFGQRAMECSPFKNDALSVSHIFVNLIPNWVQDFHPLIGFKRGSVPLHSSLEERLYQKVSLHSHTQSYAKGI